MSLMYEQEKLISIWKVVHRDSFWNRGAVNLPNEKLPEGEFWSKEHENFFYAKQKLRQSSFLTEVF